MVVEEKGSRESMAEKPDEVTSTDVSINHEGRTGPEPDAETTPSAPASEVPQEDDSQYPTGLTLILIITSLCLSVFLVALDQTIIAPALGAITTEFQSTKDIVSRQSPLDMT
jgi:hypothetical protein